MLDEGSGRERSIPLCLLRSSRRSAKDSIARGLPHDSCVLQWPESAASHWKNVDSGSVRQAGLADHEDKIQAREASRAVGTVTHILEVAWSLHSIHSEPVE